MAMHQYSQNARETIAQSSFRIEPGIYVYTKVKSIPPGRHFFVSQDGDEITVVTEQMRLAEFDFIERNKDDYSLIALNVSVPFYSVGFLATVCEEFAKHGMNVLIVSTYSRDYVLVRADLTTTAKDILLQLGFKQD